MTDQDPKIRTLQQQGTLNPRPKTVRDELFLQDNFFDPRDLVQVKYEMRRRVRTEGQSVTEAASNFGFSRPSFYQAQSAFEQDGLAGLVPHQRAPQQAPNSTEEVLTFIGAVRQDEPSIRLPDLVKRIQKRFGTKVHPRSIERSLLRHQKKLRSTGTTIDRRPSRSGLSTTSNYVATPSAGPLTAAKAWASRFFSDAE